MPAPYGVTPEGFSRPSLQELLALIEADQRAEISQTLDLSTDSVLGQVNGIYARHLSLAWEAIEAIYNGTDPDRAEDDQLTSISKLTGTERRGESKSEIVEEVVLEAGVTLLAGTHFVHVDGKPDVRFTPQVNFTAPGPGTLTYERTFEAENPGPVQAPAGTLNVIATPVVGWLSAVNVNDVSSLGRLVDSNPTLRIRREQALALAGGSTTEGIRADVLAVPDVTSVQVFENWTDATVDGLPAKSFHVVLWDDAGADDDAIAQAIWKSKPGGIRPFGSESGTATDANGDTHTMYFSRAGQVAIYVSVTLQRLDGYVGDTTFKQTLATNLDDAMGTGEAVTEWDIADAAHGLGAKVKNIRIGTAAAPTLDADIPIGQLQIARFDTSRIVID